MIYAVRLAWACGPTLAVLARAGRCPSRSDVLPYFLGRYPRAPYQRPSVRDDHRGQCVCPWSPPVLTTTISSEILWTYLVRQRRPPVARPERVLMLHRVEPLPHDVQLQGLVGHVSEEAVVVEGRPEEVTGLQQKRARYVSVLLVSRFCLSYLVVRPQLPVCRRQVDDCRQDFPSLSDLLVFPATQLLEFVLH